MPFEIIENVRPAKVSQTVPQAGVAVRAHTREFKKNNTIARWVELTIGAALAPKLVLRGDEIGVAIAFGSGNDAGKIGISVDATARGFVAKRRTDGSYRIAVNEASCDGLFAMAFPPFKVEDVKVVEAIGKPPMAVFMASEPMLAAGD